jgi:hypothetical protein
MKDKLLAYAQEYIEILRQHSEGAERETSQAA